MVFFNFSGVTELSPFFITCGVLVSPSAMSRRTFSDLFVGFSDDVVALAGGFLQPISVRKRDPSAFHAENSSLLEDRYQDAYRGPVRAQQMREKVFRHGKAVCVDTVERH